MNATEDPEVVALDGGAATYLQLLVIQPTALCNLNCKYCYVPERNNARRLAFSTLTRLFETLVSSHLIKDQKEIEVLWHAGEPLTVGISYYQRAFQIIKEILGDRWKAKHTVQTNGTLLTSAWCKFLAEHDVAVGVSLDGPRLVHDEQRPLLGGGGSFDKVMQGIERLRESGISINVLCVLTPASLRHPGRIFNFFLSEGINNVAFNVEETEGVHQLSSLASLFDLEQAKAAYSSFMQTLYRLNKAAHFPLRIREFQALAQHIQKRRRWPGYVPEVAEQRLGAILTMTREGLLTSWSPELASAAPNRLSSVVLGDVNNGTSIDEILGSDRARTIQAEIRRGVDRCRRECKYFAVCGGGSPSNKFFEHGTFAATQTLQCILHTQTLTEVLLNELRSS
jgi:uncharacterized protein